MYIICIYVYNMYICIDLFRFIYIGSYVQIYGTVSDDLWSYFIRCAWNVTCCLPARV